MPDSELGSGDPWGEAHKNAVVLLMLALGTTVVKMCDAVEETWTPEAFMPVLSGFAGALASVDDDPRTLRLMQELLAYVMVSIGRSLQLRDEQMYALAAQVDATWYDGLSTQIDEILDEDTSGDG